MMHKLLYHIFFITLTTHNIFSINGHVLPVTESHINMTDSEFNSLISLTFGSFNNEGTVNGNEKLDKPASEINNTDVQSSTSESSILHFKPDEMPSTLLTNNPHTAEKREIDTKTSSSTESLLPEDYNNDGCICVPYYECDPSNRTISADLEGLLDERSRPCDNPHEVLCGCNSPTNNHQEDQITSNNHKSSSTQTDNTGSGSSQNFNCVCQQENKVDTDETHHVTIGHGPHGHPHESSGNSGTNKPSDELHCVCQRKQIYEPSEKTNYGHHHIYKPATGDSETSRQSEELHCVCQHGLTQTTNKWSYGQTHHKDGNSSHSHSSGSSYDSQQGYTNSNTGSSYQTTEGTIYGKHDNTDISGGTSGSTYSYSNSHSSAESHHSGSHHSGSGYTNSINENTSDLYQTTDKTGHDNHYNSGTSGSTGISNSYSHSQSESHTSGETNYGQDSHSQNKDDKTSTGTSHHTADQSNYGNQGYSTGTYGNTDSSHSNSQSTVSHQQNNSHNDESGSSGIHTTHDDKHHNSGAEGNTGATHSYSYSHAEAGAHSTAGSSHDQDEHNQSGTTSSLNQHSSDKTHGYTFTTESTTNTDSHSYSQSEAHSESSGGTSYSNEDQHLDGHKSSTTSSHHDTNLSNHNQHGETDSGHTHSSTGIDSHTLSSTDKIDHTKQTSGTYGGTGTTNSYSYSHAEAEAHSSTSGTSYNQGQHTQDHSGISNSAHHEHTSGIDETSGTTHSAGVTTNNQQHGQDTTSQQHTHEQNHNTYGTGSTSSTSHSNTQSQSSGGTSYGQDSYSHGQDSTSTSHKDTDDKNHGYSSGTDGSTGSSSSNSHSQSNSGEISNGKGDSFHNEQGSTDSSHNHSDDKTHGQHGSTSNSGTGSTSSTSSSSYSHSSSNSYSSGGTSHSKDENSNKQDGSSSHHNTNEQSHTSGTEHSGDSHGHSSAGSGYGQTQSNEGSNSASISHSDSNSQSSSGSYGSSHGSTDQSNYDHHDNKYNSSSNHLPTEEPYEFEGCGYSKDSVIAQRIKSDSPDSESLFGQFPWMVAILTKTKDPKDEHKDKVSFVCGGSLIHEQVVLTATHSIIKKDEKTLAVRAGEWNAQANDEIVPHQQQDVERVIRHPDYYSGGLYNDISLIKLKKPFHFADNVNIICLPPPNLPIDYTEKCMVSGWGKESLEKTSKFQPILRQVDLPLVPHQQCQDKLRKTRLGDKFKLHNSFICAGGELNKDTCLGDGGGPLVCPVKGSIDRYYQVGIVSWGIGCGSETPAVYANVKSFLKWIDEQMHKLHLKSQYHY